MVKRFAGVMGIMGLLAAGGCAVDSRPAFEAVDAAVYQRAGQHVRWNQDTGADREADGQVEKLLAKELAADAAVEVALLKNAGLQGKFEEIGIAQADLVQAGLLKNPVFAASWRVADRAGRGTDAEYAVSQDFLEVAVVPLRKKVAAARLERTQAEVADAVLTLAEAVKEAFYAAQAEALIGEQLQTSAAAGDAALEIARRQHAAGNINDLDLANQEAGCSQVKIEVVQAQLALTMAREKMGRLLGVEPGRWRLVKAMLKIPADEGGLSDLEELSLKQRLDYAAARRGVEALAAAAGMTKDFRYGTAVTVGVDTEHNPGGPNVTGPTLELELPIFDQGQGRVAAAEGRYRQGRRELEELRLRIRSEVREAQARVLAERDLALELGKTLVPQRRKIVELTQRHYNAMLKGVYELLAAKQSEAAAQRDYIEALRDYWIARARLERAVGGELKSNPPATAATQPAKDHDRSAPTHGEMR